MASNRGGIPTPTPPVLQPAVLNLPFSKRHHTPQRSSSLNFLVYEPLADPFKSPGPDVTPFSSPVQSFTECKSTEDENPCTDPDGNSALLPSLSHGDTVQNQPQGSNPDMSEPKHDPQHGLESVHVREHHLSVIYSPENPEDVLADVIFVHGLAGHPRKTWEYATETKRSGLSKTVFKGKQESVFWPKDLLPNDQKNIRILTYGYDSHVSWFFAGPANKMGISQHGEALLNRLVGERARSNCFHRPIVFVAHSLGGLLVKEALIEARKQNNHPGKLDVTDSTQGIVFFGTPHQGSGDAKWGLVLSNIASVAFETNKKILQSLDPDRDKLDSLSFDFQDILEEGKIRVCSLQESAGKTGFPVFNGKVVPDSSSCFRSRKYEYRDYIDNNHMDMCRFTGKDDSGYIRFKDGLAFCMQDIVELSRQVAEQKSAEARQRQEAMLRSLNYEDMFARELQLYDVNTKTCEWVWSEEKGNGGLAEWLSSDKAMFWIQGKPGSGKSTLMNYLKDHKQTLTYLRKGHKLPWTLVRFFFDFRARKGISNDLEGLLKSLLFQIVLENPEILKIIEDYGIDHNNVERCLAWDVKRLRQALLTALSRYPQNICIFVDGLDEYEGGRGDTLDMIGFFRALTERKPEAISIVKVCVASRPKPLLLEAFAHLPGFCMQNHNMPGIEKYVTWRLSNPRNDDEPLVQLSKSIVAKADGVFLWARFAINDLIEGSAEGEDLDQLRERLESLPEDLKHMYVRVLSRVKRKQQNRKETAIMLHLCCYSCRPLELHEFMIAAKFASDWDIKGPIKSKAEMQAFRKRIAARSGGLIEVVDAVVERSFEQGWKFLSHREWKEWSESEVPRWNQLDFRRLPNGPSKEVNDLQVKLVHETVKTYLHHSEWMEDLGLETVLYFQPHGLMLDFCLNYLQAVFESNKSMLKSYLSSGLIDAGLDSVRENFPLFSYAIRYIFEHARSYESVNHFSTYHVLQEYVSKGGEIFKLHFLAAGAMSYYCGSRGYDCRSCNSGHAFGIYSKCPSNDSNSFLSIAALHGLLLYCQDALKAENVTKGKDDLLSCAIASTISSPETGPQLISLMLENGATVSDTDMFRAIEFAAPAALTTLLEIYPIECENASLYFLGIENIWGDVWGKLKILVEIGQDEQIHGHEETLLWNLTKVRSHISRYDKDWEKIKTLVIRDNKAPYSIQPKIKTLEFLWRKKHTPWWSRIDMQRWMRCLLSGRASTNHDDKISEPIKNRHEVEAWCNLPEPKLKKMYPG